MIGMMSTEPIPAPSLADVLDQLSATLHENLMSTSPSFRAGFDMCHEAVREYLAAVTA